MRSLLLAGAASFDLAQYDLEWLKQPHVSVEFMHRHRILPLWCKDNHLYIATADRQPQAAIAALSFQTGKQIHPLLVDKNQLDKLLLAHLNPLALQLESTLSKLTVNDKQAEQDELVDTDDEPVIEFVTRLLNDAKEKHISDIHIEPYETNCRIRFRRDGLLYEVARIPLYLSIRVIARLKLLANLDIAERRKPQDGRLHVSAENKMDIRMNTCPTIFGEKMVLRFLSQENMQLDIAYLGLNEQQKQLFLERLERPQGLILITECNRQRKVHDYLFRFTALK